ncbi:hypothetical protein [Streptomyces sp. S1]|uniref:hypothetical protein n=1 Tax=Streptomyces sp. S1 TaxID=718288 RepID=UPI003D70F1AB
MRTDRRTVARSPLATAIRCVRLPPWSYGCRPWSYDSPAARHGGREAAALTGTFRFSHYMNKAGTGDFGVPP